MSLSSRSRTWVSRSSTLLEECHRRPHRPSQTQGLDYSVPSAGANRQRSYIRGCEQRLVMSGAFIEARKEFCGSRFDHRTPVVLTGERPHRDYVGELSDRDEFDLVVAGLTSQQIGTVVAHNSMNPG